VQAVVQELRGERIDIITWTPDEPSFVARALAPAEVSRVVVDEDEQSMEVIVADDQLSLAIGRRGQNVKLASKLTGWKIDVRSISVAEEEAKRARSALEEIPGIEFTYAEMLFQEGYRNAKEVADAFEEDLLEIEGFDEEKVKAILESARAHVAALGLDSEDSNGTGHPTDLDKLLLHDDVRDKLIGAGFGDIQTLVSADNDEFKDRAGLSEEEIADVRDAMDSFFRQRAPLPTTA
jgi:N utilization substance protein A